MAFADDAVFLYRVENIVGKEENAKIHFAVFIVEFEKKGQKSPLPFENGGILRNKGFLVDSNK